MATLNHDYQQAICMFFHFAESADLDLFIEIWGESIGVEHWCNWPEEKNTLTDIHNFLSSLDFESQHKLNQFLNSGRFGGGGADQANAKFINNFMTSDNPLRQAFIMEGIRYYAEIISKYTDKECSEYNDKIHFVDMFSWREVAQQYSQEHSEYFNPPKQGPK